MTTEGQQQTEYVSLTPLFDNNSMEAWIQALLEDRRCMDCKIELAECEGTTEFRGRLPQVELVGNLCEECWEQREAIRRLRNER